MTGGSRSRMSRRRRAVVLTCTVLLAGIIGGCVHDTGASERQRMTASDLVNAVAVGSHMSSTRWHRSSPEPVLLPGGAAGVSWEYHSDKVSITVTEFSSPYAATWAFTVGDPTAPAADDFDSSPRSARFDLGTSPDQAAAWCVVDSQGGCYFWMYWARFGQYLLLAKRFSPDGPMADVEFAGYVDSFVRAMNAALPHR
jgi:hypothetical protein